MVRQDVPGPPRLGPMAGDPSCRSAFLPAPMVQNHAANLHEMANGDLACVWFAGTQEGIADIGIWMARLPAGKDRWGEPVRLSDDRERSEQNPILFTAPDGRLWLLHTAQKAGNQETALVRCRISPDGGSNWSAPRQLFDEPGIFVRQPPVVADDGAWLLPVFRCRRTGKQPWTGGDDTSSVMVSTDEGRSWREHPVPESRGCVHMNIVRLADGGMLALYRSRFADFVHASRSDGLGRDWTPPEPTALPNNNASIQATALSDGTLALVYNHADRTAARERRLSLYDDIAPAGVEPEAGPAADAAFWGAPRAPLTLTLSEDGGRTWPLRRDIETGDGYCMTNNSKDGLNRELSYPSIIQSRDGRLQIAYTWWRRAIRHVSLDPNRVASP